MFEYFFERNPRVRSLIFGSTSSMRRSWGQKVGRGDKSIQVLLVLLLPGSEFHQYLSATKTDPTGWSSLSGRHKTVQCVKHQLNICIHLLDHFAERGFLILQNIIEHFRTLTNVIWLHTTQQSLLQKPAIISKPWTYWTCSTRSPFVDGPAADDFQPSHFRDSLGIVEAVPNGWHGLPSVVNEPSMNSQFKQFNTVQTVQTILEIKCKSSDPNVLCCPAQFVYIEQWPSLNSWPDAKERTWNFCTYLAIWTIDQRLVSPPQPPQQWERETKQTWQESLASIRGNFFKKDCSCSCYGILWSVPSITKWTYVPWSKHSTPIMVIHPMLGVYNSLFMLKNNLWFDARHVELTTLTCPSHGWRAQMSHESPKWHLNNLYITSHQWPEKVRWIPN